MPNQKKTVIEATAFASRREKMGVDEVMITLPAVPVCRTRSSSLVEMLQGSDEKPLADLCRRSSNEMWVFNNEQMIKSTDKVLRVLPN